MGRKRRGKSVRNNRNILKEADEDVNAPHSFVIHKGFTGGFVEELTHDFRKVMEPFTATSLKEKKSNTIKDFVHVAALMHVSHMCIFTRTELGVYLKLGRLPRGPTLTFKLHNFSLARDVVTSLKKQLVVARAFKTSPLIVLNNFSGEGMQFKLMASMFQNMFPTLNLRKVDLNTVRRVVMLNYNAETKRIDFRHYTIKVGPVGISKGVKKMVGGKVPNLAKCEDIAEFLTKSGVLSESEAEDDPNSHVTLSQKMAARGNIESGKSSIRLSELGPRLTMQLMKIEDGLLDGEVLYHDLVQKTEEEKAEIKKARDAKKKLKEKRKKIQNENARRKEHEKETLKEKSLQGMKKVENPGETLDNKVEERQNPRNEERRGVKRRHQDDTENAVEEDDDAQYYRDEVGEEPDQDLFTSRTTGFKRPKTFHSFKHKKRLDDGNTGNRGGNRGNRGGNRGNRDNKFSRNNDRDRDNKSNFRGSNKKFGGRGGGRNDRDRGDRSRGGKSFGSGKGKQGPREKTNASNRDFRPIGGKTGGRKFSGKRK